MFASFFRPKVFSSIFFVDSSRKSHCKVHTMESVYVACIEYKFSGAVLPVNASIYLQRVLTGLVQEKEFTDCVCVVV